MKRSTSVLAGALIALSVCVPACFAEEKAATPEASPQAQPAPATPDNAAPAMKSRSLRKAPEAGAAPVPPLPSKDGLASPDDTIGGLPGAKQATVEKQP